MFSIAFRIYFNYKISTCCVWCTNKIQLNLHQSLLNIHAITNQYYNQDIIYKVTFKVSNNGTKTSTKYITGL